MCVKMCQSDLNKSIEKFIKNNHSAQTPLPLGIWEKCVNVYKSVCQNVSECFERGIEEFIITNRAPERPLPM